MAQGYSKGGSDVGGWRLEKFVQAGCPNRRAGRPPYPGFRNALTVSIGGACGRSNRVGDRSLGKEEARWLSRARARWSGESEEFLSRW
jgi:hypothetical protein